MSRPAFITLPKDFKFASVNLVKISKTIFWRKKINSHVINNEKIYDVCFRTFSSLGLFILLPR